MSRTDKDEPLQLRIDRLARYRKATKVVHARNCVEHPAGSSRVRGYVWISPTEYVWAWKNEPRQCDLGDRDGLCRRYMIGHVDYFERPERRRNIPYPRAATSSEVRDILVRVRAEWNATGDTDVELPVHAAPHYRLD